MKIKSLAIITATALGACALGLSAVAQIMDNSSGGGASGGKSKKEQGPSGAKEVSFQGVELAKEISKEEAMKKYPPPRGGYPEPQTTEGPNTGVSSMVVASPYPPHHRFDTSGVKRGGLILDPYAKHVFVKP